MRLAAVRHALRPGARRWTVTGLAAAVLIAGGAIAYASHVTAVNTASETLATVSRGSVTVGASAAGTIAEATVRGLSFSMSGTVTAVNVRPGDTVTTGEVLATIDAGTAQADLTAAQDAVASADQALATAQATPTAGATSTTCPTAPASYPTAAPTTSTTRSPAPATSTATATSINRSPGTGQSASPGGSYPTRSTSSPSGGSGGTGSGTAGNRGGSCGTGSGSGLGGGTGSGGSGSGGSGSGGSGSGATGRGAGGVYAAQQQLNNAELALTQAQQQLAGTTIAAPEAGKVLTVAGVVGSGESPGSTPFILLGGLNNAVVQAQFSQADATRLAIGQPATITLPDHPGQTYTGRVTEIDPAGSTSGNLVLFGATISFDQPPAGLLYGQSADVTVTVATATGVLYLPSAAVTGVAPATGSATTGTATTGTPTTGTATTGTATTGTATTGTATTGTVFIRSGGGYVARTVGVGLRGDQYTEITYGLNLGDQVLVNAGG